MNSPARRRRRDRLGRFVREGRSVEAGLLADRMRGFARRLGPVPHMNDMHPEDVDEAVQQGRLPIPDCSYCGMKLECPDPARHVHGVHGRECPATRHATEECERSVAHLRARTALESAMEALEEL